MKFVIPKYDLNAYICPYCGTLSQQIWDRYRVIDNIDKDVNN